MCFDNIMSLIGCFEKLHFSLSLLKRVSINLGLAKKTNLESGKKWNFLQMISLNQDSIFSYIFAYFLFTRSSKVSIPMGETKKVHRAVMLQWNGSCLPTTMCAKMIMLVHMDGCTRTWLHSSHIWYIFVSSLKAFTNKSMMHWSKIRTKSY